MALTDAAIKAAKPAAKLFRITDSNGLCLEIAPTGSKLWRYRYRFNDKAKMLALGTYPALSLLKARQKRDEAREQLANGIDPGEQKKAAKQAQKVIGLTFEGLAREWCSGQLIPDTSIGGFDAIARSYTVGGRYPSFECSRSLL